MDASPATVAEVIARMEAIRAALPKGDGVRSFTELYLAVTQAVNETLGTQSFRDPKFLGRLDVVFADLYFSALDTFATAPDRAPRAWVPLIEARSRRGIAPIQFALAGMNAHINRDLPVALVSVCEELGIELTRDSPQHADFERVNGLLAATEAKVKRAYATGLVGFLDRVLGHVDDRIAMWDVGRARDAAWTNAEALWALRGAPDLSDGFLQTLDRMVGFASRGLLVPARGLLRGLLRL